MCWDRALFFHQDGSPKAGKAMSRLTLEGQGGRIRLLIELRKIGAVHGSPPQRPARGPQPLQAGPQ